MSGPKSSRYALTQWQRQQLQEQLRKAREARLLEERKNKEIENILSSCSEIEKTMQGIQAYIDKADELAKEGHEAELDKEQIAKVCSEAMATISKAKKLSSKKSLEEIQAENKNVRKALRNIFETYNESKKQYFIQEETLRSQALSKVSLGFNLSFDQIVDRKSLSKNETKQRVDRELGELLLEEISTELQEKFKVLQKKASEIKSVDYIENFYSLSVSPFIKECKKYIQLNDEVGDDYRLLMQRYMDLAKELGKPCKTIPMSETCISELLEEISALEEEELKIREEAYICQCIDEALREMDYSLIGEREVTKKNGKQFRNNLYKFDEGTAVNVTYSSDGQITMELGGLDRSDREPTDAESRSLEEDMRAFCDDFYLIEKKLKEKGIEPKRISHLPAEAQFAQIINVSDYEMKEDVGIYEAKRKKKSAQASANTLHKEG